MRSTASLTSRFCDAERCTSAVSVESLKLDHQATDWAPSEVTCAAPSVPLAAAVDDHCAGTFGFGLTKFGPTAQLASAQPREASARERSVCVVMVFLRTGGQAAPSTQESAPGAPPGMIGANGNAVNRR